MSTSYDHLLTEVQTQNQAIELLSEIVQAYHNREMELNETVDKVVQLHLGHKFIHLLIPYLNPEIHGFQIYFDSIAELSTKIEYAETTDESFEFDRDSFIIDLSPAKRRLKSMIIKLIARYKKQDREVLMNIPRKILATAKYQNKKNNSEIKTVVNL